MLPKSFKFTPWRFSKFDSPTAPGSPVKVKYSGRYDKEGNIVLDEVGTENIYDEIQSFAEVTDINNIMRRYMHGDVDAIEKAQGFYFDVTQLPDNMPELLNKLDTAKEQFNKLPADFKEIYRNDFGNFLVNFDPADYIDLVDAGSGSSSAVQADAVKEEVISDES